MPKAPLPADENERLASLRTYDVMDTGAEASFDDLVKLAATITGAPVSLITLLDADRQWFKAKVGTDLTQTPRDMAFCGWTILGHDMLVVPDLTADARFADNPLVTSDPNIRFYAGAPLVTPAGHALGSLCVIDTVPRELSATQVETLRILSRQAVSLLRLRRALRDSAASERFARSTVNALASQIAILDERGEILAVNLAWEQFAAANGGSAAAVGENYLAECDRATGACAGEAKRVATGIRDVLAGRQSVFTLEYPCHSPAEQRWFTVRVTPFPDAGPTRLVVCHENVTERYAATERLRHDSLHDALTGLPNRAHFAERVDRCIAMANRRPMPFGVLFLDLDRFKIINDSLGHLAGDRLLTTIADRLRRAVRPGDLVARMGGDEFTLLLEELRLPGDAARVAERVRAAVAVPVDYEGHELMTTVSIGIVTSGTDESGEPYTTAKDLLRDADAAMYKAKTNGKDRYVVFDQAMHAEVVQRMQLEADLRRAVNRDQFELNYQPIMSLSHIVGFEALLRWRRNGLLVNPVDFIPVAEDTGLIVPIGAWVLRRACQQLADWRSMGGPAMANLYMTINVSRRQLVDPRLAGTVLDALRESQVPSSAVVLEITESAMMEDSDGAEQTLVDLKRQTGVRLAMDDFGAGYSSLSCLQRFPIDLLKVDRSFVEHVTHNRRDAAVMRTIAALAHDLGMSVVAEGVERPEQAAFLAGVQCDLIQGFLFSRPLEAASAERFARDSANPALAA